MKKTALLFVGLMLTMLTWSYAVTHTVYPSMIPNPGRYLGCMSDSGWDGEEICSAQVDDVCPTCYNCCGDTYTCARAGGFGYGSARAKWDACLGHCITDLQGCDEMPDSPPNGGAGSGGGSGS